MGLEEDKITWHSNACYTLLPVWKKIKLHGTQTIKDEAQSASEVWKKIKLHGTQTTIKIYVDSRRVWKKIKLHGSQILCE